VGGQGWRWQAHEFLGGTAQQEQVRGDVELFRRTLSFENYAPRIRCPVLHRSATNDFHGWMDDVYHTNALIPGQPLRFAWTPHMNHRLSPEVAVTLPLEEYKLIMKRPDRAEILDRNLAELRALDLRVGILFRPVVMAYLTAFTDLKEGKTKDMDKRIVTLREFALIAYQKSNAVRDYLDVYEANESGTLTGKFDDYLNLPSIIKKELPPRTDPISK